MNTQNQLTLLSDILKSQQAQNYGTEDEFNQIQRLANALLSNGQLDENMQQVLANIANYCSTRDCQENESQIDQWVQTINEMNVPYPHE